jgi:hypothetical protein
MKKILLLCVFFSGASLPILNASEAGHTTDPGSGGANPVSAKSPKRFLTFAEKLAEREKRNAHLSSETHFVDYLPLTGGTLFRYDGAQLRLQGWDDLGGNDSNNGSLLIGGTSYYASIHYNASSPSLYFDNSYNSDNGDFYFRTKVGGTPINAFTIKGSGWVGIGSAAPFTNLSVGNYVGIGTTNDALGDMYGKDGLVFQTNGGAYRGAAIVGKQVGTYGIDLIFGTKYAGGNELKERMRITNTGELGIGTTSPAAILHVKKDYDGVATQMILENTASGADQGNAIFFKGYYNQAKITSHENPGNHTGGNLQLQTYADNATLNTGVVITKEGKIGMGTETPSAAAHVYQSGASLTTPTLLVQDFSTDPATDKDVFKIIGRDNAGSSFLLRVLGNNGTIQGMTVTDEGLVGLGTNSPAEKLTVSGNIYASGNISAFGQIKTKKVVVTQTHWPDFVFDKQYNLRSLSSLEAFINEKKHLPEMPSASEVELNGLSVGDTQALLLKKIEELTLYVIALKKENEAQQKQIDRQAKKEHASKSKKQSL